MKTSELTGRSLDWAVAMCEGAVTELVFDGITHGFKIDGTLKVLSKGWASMSWHPSSDWSQAGPIIEREKIGTTRVDNNPDIWAAHITDPWRTSSNVYSRLGPTPLVAAMRCYCCSKLGEEVEIPENLK